MCDPERLYPQNVVGAILVPIFLWSIGPAAGEKAEYVSENGKSWAQSHPDIRSETQEEDANKFTIHIQAQG